MAEIIGIILGGIIWFAIARKKGSVKMQRIAIISCASLLLTTLFGVIGLLIAIVSIVGYILVEKHLKDDSKSEKNNEADDSKSVNKNEADENKTIEQPSIERKDDKKDDKRNDNNIQAETNIKKKSDSSKTEIDYIGIGIAIAVFLFVFMIFLCIALSFV